MGIRFHLPLPGPFVYTPDRNRRAQGPGPGLAEQRYAKAAEKLATARLAVQRAQTPSARATMEAKAEQLAAEADRAWLMTPDGKAYKREAAEADRMAEAAEVEAEAGTEFKNEAHANAYLFARKARDKALAKAEEAEAAGKTRKAKNQREYAARIERKMLAKHAPK